MYKINIPEFHFKPASQKLGREWMHEATKYWNQGGRMRNLLYGKSVREIEEYASGKFSLGYVRKLFKSLRKQHIKQNGGNWDDLSNATNIIDPTGISWECVPLIEKRLTPAKAAMEKIPFEYKLKCMDATAYKRKQEDLDFLKNKPEMEAYLQEFADSMNFGKVDLGTTKYSSVPYGGIPLGLDLNDESEFNLFAEMIYNYAPESAFTTLLKTLYEVKRVSQIRSMEIKDQFHYAVSCNRTVVDGVTGLPDVKYVYPGNVWTDACQMQDYSDRNATMLKEYVTPNELINMFGDEIRSMEHLEEIVNKKTKETSSLDNGYVACNYPGMGHWKKEQFATERMTLLYWEIKSSDFVYVAERKGKYGSWAFYVDDPKKYEGDKNITIRKQWAQNTYCFYQLENTGHFFAAKRLPYAFRTLGSDVYSGSSINIYRSKERSAVELSIGENKKAQIAEIKLQNHVIKALGPGYWIDVKGIRDFLMSQEDTPDKMSFEAAMEAMVEQNRWPIDSSGFEGKMNGQYTPFKEIPGGLKDEIVGYLKLIVECDNNIAAYMGINDQLAGQAISQDSLVGLQKIMLNQSINGLSYVQDAIKSNYQYVFNAWVRSLQDIVESKGSPYNAVVNMIGTAKADIIDAMDAIPMHQIGLVLNMGSTVEQQEYFKMKVQQSKLNGVINSSEEYYVLGIEDYREASLVLGVLENKHQKRIQQQQQAQMENMLQVKQQEGQNMLQNTQAAQQFKMQEQQKQFEMQSEMLRLANQLQLSTAYQEGLLKRQLQSERIGLTGRNRESQMKIKQELENQQSMLA